MPLSGFFELIRPHRFAYICVIVAAATIAVAEASIQPLLMKAIFDGVAQHASYRKFLLFGIYYILLGASSNFLNFIVSTWRYRVDNNIILSVETRSLQVYFESSYEEVIDNGAGHYLARIHMDAKDGLAPALEAFREIIVVSGSFIALIVVLVYLSWTAFLLLVSIIPLCSFLCFKIGRRIKLATDIERQSEASIIDILTKSILAFKIIQSSCLLESTLSNFERSLHRGLAMSYNRFRMVRLLQAAGDMTKVSSDVSFIFVGAYLVTIYQIGIGSFVAFMNAFWRSSSALFGIINKIAEFHGYSSIISRISQYQSKPPFRLKNVSFGAMSLKNVNFSYKNISVLKDVTFDIGSNERILIVGKNGSGKTTLANILSGFLDPSSGVMSSPGKVSSATLPTNFPPMAVSKLGLDQGLLDELGIGHQDIRDNRPDLLSAGQQQKLAIALTISLDAKIYVLDEPLANIDSQSQDAVLRQILYRTVGKTLIIIAHDQHKYQELFDRVIDLGSGIGSGRSAARV